MAKSDQARIVCVEEVTIGTIPATPAWESLRLLSDSLTHQANNVENAELALSPGITGQSRGGLNISGTLEMPLCYNWFVTYMMRAVIGDAGGWLENTEAVPAFTRYGFAIEKGFIDSANVRRFHRFIGMSASSVKIAYAPLQPISASFGMVGGRFEVADAEIAGSTYNTPSPDGPETCPQMRSANVNITWGGSLSVLNALCHTALEITLDRQNTARECIGRESAEEWELGTLRATISATVLYGGNDLQEAQLAGEEVSLIVEMLDDTPSPNNHVYRFEFPRVKIMQAPVPTPTKGQDVVIALEAEALQPTAGNVVEIFRDTQ